MAHKLNFNENGDAAFYSTRIKAWHEEGFIADKYEPSAVVIKRALLDYPVIKQPIEYSFPSGKKTVSDNQFYTFRADTEQVLGTGLGADYTVVQNTEAFAFFDEIAKGEGMLYETAGALGDGERIFITAKLPKYIKVAGDFIEQYLFLTMSHDGKSSITVAFTPIRIVCNNTLNVAMNNCSNIVRIRHTANVHEQLKEAPKVMGMVNTLSPLFEQCYNEWAHTKIKDEQVFRLIQQAMAPDKQTLDNILQGAAEKNSGKYKSLVYSIMGYATHADTQKLDTTKGTLFGAFNAVTGYFQNVKDYKTSGDKIDAIIHCGAAQKKIQAAFDLCMEYYKHGENALMLN